MSRPQRCAYAAASLQVACAVTVIALTAGGLMDSQLWPRHGGHSLCYLSRDSTHEGPCSFAIAAGAVGLASAVLSACLRCLSLDCCGLGPIGSIALAGINSLWWVLAAALLTAAAVDADAGGVPGAAARHALLAAAWLAAATEAAHSIAACATVGNNVCNVLFCAPLLPAAEDECCAGCEECCVGSGHHGGGCCCCRSRRWRRHHTAPLLPHGTTITPAGAVVIATAGAAVGRSWLDAFRPRPQPNMHVPAMASVGPYGPAPPCPGAAWPHTATAHGAAALPSSGGYMPPPPTAGSPYMYAAEAPPQAQTSGLVAPSAPLAPPAGVYAPPVVLPAPYAAPGQHAPPASGMPAYPPVDKP